MRLVVDWARRKLSLTRDDLPDEFYPAHLSVALIDAVLRPRREEQAAAVVERYCRRFDVARTAANRWKTPRVEEQEPLGALVARFDALGMAAMGGEVFGADEHTAPEGVREAKIAFEAAQCLRSIGVEVLQDMTRRPPAEVEYALGALSGVTGHSVRMLLMYTGGEAFVRGDFPLRHFVADALGKDSVTALQAVGVVRKAAHELILPPRFLDYEIWRYVARRTARSRRAVGPSPG